MNQESFCHVPEINPNYVKYGNYDDIVRIIESRNFYPVWITGDAGTGKTQLIQQACANLGRKFVRFNFTTETDETDMIGGMRLVEKNGVTVTEFYEGAIVQAMREGAILLLDEVDAGHTNKILALQSILEGEGVMIKEKNEFVKPAKGFNIFATSNTKGKGSDDGRFIGTQIMNSAFLDRFAGMMFQDFPIKKIEEDILKSYFIEFMFLSKGLTTKDIPKESAKEGIDFISSLCDWAGQIRITYKDQGVEEVVSTRTLINVIKGFSIFNDKQKSILYACERYPNDIKENFLQIYDKLCAEPEIRLKGNRHGKTTDYDSLSNQQISF